MKDYIGVAIGMVLLMIFIIGMTMYVIQMDDVTADGDVTTKVTVVSQAAETTTESQKLVVDEPKVIENLESIEIETLAYYGQESYYCEGILKDGLHYLDVNTFIDVCNLMNKQLKMIDDLTTDYFDFENNILSLTYKVDGKPMRESIDNEFATTYFQIEDKRMIEVNTKMDIPLTGGFFELLEANGDIFLPLDLIRYEIFANDAYLIRKDEAVYQFLDSRSLRFFNVYRNDFSQEIKGEQVSYNKALNAFEYYNQFDLSVDEMTDYSNYYFELLKRSEVLEDYHSNIYEIEEVDYDQLDELGYDDYIDNNFIQDMINAYSTSKMSSDYIIWDYVEEGTILIDIDSFHIDPDFFRERINKLVHFINDHEDIHTMIIDIRDNGGGYSSNLFYALSEILGSDFTLNMEYLNNNQVIANYEYDFKRYKQKDKSYDYYVVVNETSASASIIFTGIMKDYGAAKVIGREPLYKQSERVNMFQFLDGTIYTISSPCYHLLTKSGERLDDSILVVEYLEDEAINNWIYND